MSAEVKVHVEFLDTLIHTVQNTSMRLGSGASVPNCDFSRSPEVAEAWRGLHRRYDENSNKIVEKLDGLADALQAIRESFVGTDQQLASSLDGSAAGGS